MSVEFVDNSDEFLRAFGGKTLKALETVGLQAERDVKAVTPVDTGRLRNSITHATSKSVGTEIYKDDSGKVYGGGSARKKAGDNTLVIGTNVEYAVHQEFSGNAGQGYMRYGLTNGIEKYKAILETELGELKEFNQRKV